MRVGVPSVPEAGERPNTSITLLESPHNKFERHFIWEGWEIVRREFYKVKKELVMSVFSEISIRC